MSTDLQTTEKTIESAAVIVPTDVSAAALEMAVGMGDFSRLQPNDRLRYIAGICQSLKLNPLTLPFRIMKLDGRDVLYATADCGAQLRARDKISIKLTSRSYEHGCVVITAHGSTPDGRQDEATGAVALTYPDKTVTWENGQKRYATHPKAGQPLEGLEFANAIKKAETQAKRRVALSLAGLGFPDESELITDDAAKVRGGNLVPGMAMPESAQALADKLNEKLSAGEKENAIEAEVVPEPPKESTVAAAVAPSSQVVAPAPAEHTSASGGAAAVSSPAPAEELPFEEPPKPADDSKERDDNAMNLQIVFTENKELTKDCVAYCIFKNMLPKGPGKGLEEIDQAYAGKILKNPKGFLRSVEAWVKGGRK
jgi:hypothetical protein